jgi:hypothetical protein
MSLARDFHIKERATLQIRTEFTNIFNRTEMNKPTVTNDANAQRDPPNYCRIRTVLSLGRSVNPKCARRQRV